MAISKKKRKKNYKFGGFYPLYPNQLSNVPISNDNDTENDSGEVGTESKMIAKGKMIADKYKPANEQSSSKMIGQFDMATFKSLLFEMYKFMQQKYEVLQSNNNAPQIKLNHEEQSDPLCTTAHYQPDNKCITLYTNGRHIKDILRSCAHEVIHHIQNLEGRLPNITETPEGYAQSNQALREMEIEAFRDGNMCFRDWTDTRKNPSKKNSVNEIKVNVDFNKYEGKLGDVRINTKAYELLVQDFPEVTEIMKLLGIDHVSQFHSIHNIWYQPRTREVTLYFRKGMSLQMYFSSPGKYSLLENHKVMLQASFSDEYSYSLSISNLTKSRETPRALNEIKVITGDQLKNISDCTQLPSAEILKRIYKVTTQTISFNGFKQIWASDMYHDGTEWGTDSIAMINECLMAADWDAFFPAYMKFQDEALNEYNVPELFHQFIIVK